MKYIIYRSKQFMPKLAQNSLGIFRQWFKFLCLLRLKTERRKGAIVGRSINELKDFIDNIDDLED